MSDTRLCAYLFVIDSSQLSLRDALDKIDKIREVENWQIILPDAAVLISRKNVMELHQIVKANFPNQRYILTLLERGRKAGWLANSAWNFMNNPTSVWSD